MKNSGEKAMSVGAGRTEKQTRLRSSRIFCGALFCLAALVLFVGCQRPSPTEKPPAPVVSPVADKPAAEESSVINHRLPMGVKLGKEKNGVIHLRSWGFKNESLDHPGLKRLREKEKLDQVIAAGKDEFEKMRLLMDWVNSQWTNSAPDPYPPWDANRILALIRAGKTGGFCAQYAVVLGQAALSLGWIPRYLDITTRERDPALGHFTVELWSNQHNQWVVLDPFFDCYFEREGKPLSALEIHQALVAGESDKIKLVRGQGKNAAANSRLSDPQILAKFFHLAVDLRNNHLSSPQHFWDRRDGYLSWKDDFTDGQPDLYQRFTKNPLEFNFPLNQLQVRLVAGPAPEVLLCMMRTNAPNLETIELKINDGPWQTPPNPYTLPDDQTSPLSLSLVRLYGSVITYHWKLAPGENRLSLRPVNQAGIPGPETSFQVNFSPP